MAAVRYPGWGVKAVFPMPEKGYYELQGLTSLMLFPVFSCLFSFFSCFFYVFFHVFYVFPRY